MSKFTVNGSHFEAVSKAKVRAMLHGYADTEVELVCDDELEVYTLQTTGRNTEVIAVFDY